MLISCRPQRDERVLVVWSDNLDTIIPLCHDFEDKLIKVAWAQRFSMPGYGLPSLSYHGGSSHSSAPSASDVGLTEKVEASVTVTSAEVPSPTPKTKSTGFSWFGWKIKEKASASPDPEKGLTATTRPVRLFAPVYGGLACALSVCEFA